MAKKNITDRALRYRANDAIPEHTRVCFCCGGKGRLEVAHLDGHEENTAPDNLSWTCRSCNVSVGNVLRKNAMGRLTHQYNPTKGGGAATVGEWVQAIGAVTPHIDRGDRGLSSSMSVSDAVAMVRATPHHRRSQFAAELRKHKRSRKSSNPLFGPGGVFGSRDYTYDLGKARKKAATKAATKERQRIAAEDRATAREAKEQAKRDRRLLGARGKAKVKKSRILDSEAARGIFGGLMNPPKFDRCIKRVKARGGANAYAVCTAAGTRGKKNPAEGAAAGFEEFHGYPPTEEVRVTKQRHYHKHLSGAGKLVALEVRGIDRQTHLVKGFKEALLCFNEAKNQLFVEGGDQSLDLSEWGIKKPHELETLGKVLAIEYHTTKTHLGDEGGTAIYSHLLRTTNENGRHVVVTISRYPDLIYRVLDEQLEFSGGSYFIRAEGIDQ
jgi:hypothetical protein